MNTPNENAVDDAAVRALYQQLMDAWNEGSAEAYAESFAEGGVRVGFDGTAFEGRQ
ncbi:MAG: SgcJ/EcaC family oxidoreductase, partial [Gammaproteobacteria bacterium]|nr:SgcJ/EcaC family oxidoreductase [Gammaproteobacteria bacterium]